MAKHIHSDFLKSQASYGEAVDCWVQLWERVDPYLRDEYGWQEPWMSVDWEKDDVFMDGNPIFSAYSTQEQKGIRIIQHPPTSDEIEFEMWLDTFGGPISDPEAIRELVISCALSEEALTLAYQRMQEWICGNISNNFDSQAAMSVPFAEHFAEAAGPSLAGV